MDNQKARPSSVSDLSSDAPLSKMESDRRSAAVLLCRTLALGILRKRYPEAIESGICGIAERRVIMNLLLEWTDSETVNQAGGDQVIEEAIQRGQQG